MNKATLLSLLSQGKTDVAIERLMTMSIRWNDDIQEEIILQSGKYQSLCRDKRAGILDHEQELVQLAKVNRSLLEIINRIEYSTPHQRLKKNLVLGTLLLLGVVTLVLYGWSIGYTFNLNVKKPDPSNVKEKLEDKELRPPHYKLNHEQSAEKTKEKSAKNIPYLPSQTQGQKADTNNGNVHFKNTTVNGQIIIKPSAPINIENNFKIAKDTLLQ